MKAKTWSRIFLALGLLCATGCRRPTQQNGEAAKVRVVSLAPNITEILCAIGAEHVLVGRTSACDHPPEAVKRIPIVGGFGNPSLELLASLKPTLLLEVDVADTSIRDAIDGLGIRRETILCRGLDDIPKAVITIGRLVDRDSEANALAKGIRSQIDSLRASRPAPERLPSVYVEIWNEPLTTVGKGSFVSEMVAIAGGNSIGDSIETENFVVSPEWVVSRDPDVILCLYPTPHKNADDLVRKRLGWRDVSAVRSGNIFGGLRIDAILRPGPRVLEGIDELRKCIQTSRPTDTGTANEGP